MNLKQHTRIEPRWPVLLAIVLTSILLIILPERIRIFPAWLVNPFVIEVIICIVAVPLSGGKLIWRIAERRIILMFFVFSEIGNMSALTYLVRLMTVHANQVSGEELLASSVGVWVINVLAFSLLYWQMDRGGPESHNNKNSLKPDLLFPQNTIAEYKDWNPIFADYLFLSFTSASAFSPTDVMPLSIRAKMLMMLQSTISLVNIVVVASRAINILGS